MDCSDGRFQSNNLVFAYIVYAVLICLNDYISHFLKWDYLLTMVISGVIVAAVLFVYFRRNRVEWVIIPVNFCDKVFAAIIVFFCMLRSIIPDSMSYDVHNYHLYYQKFFDRDFIHYDFFPIRSFNAQTFGALGDRLFYGFRYFLGYRMGTLLNTLIIILIFFQIKQIFLALWKEFGHSGSSKWSYILVSGGAFVCLMTETVYANLSTYMVDYLAVPFLLEIFRIVIFVVVDNKESFNLAHMAGYLCLMSGLAMGIKITNIWFIIPFALIFLLKCKSNINIKVIVVSCVILLFPLFLYFIISYDITGNPMFPYLNGLFKSPYFSFDKSPNDFSGFNSRFGPVKVYEYILWPFYMLRFPKRVSEFALCSGRMLILAVTFSIIIFVEFRKFTQKTKYVFLYMCYCYIIFLTLFHGYMRYALILEMIGCIVFIIVFIEWTYRNNNTYKILGVFGIHFLLIQIGIASFYYIGKDYEWAWRNIKDKQRIEVNFPYVFHDYDSGIDKQILDDIECLVVADSNGSLAAELKGDVPIIGINSYFTVTNDYTKQLLEERIHKTSGMNVYSLLGREEWQDSLEVYNEFGFALDEIIPISPNFYDKLYCLPLIKLKTVDNKKVNCENYMSSEDVVTISIEEGINYIDIFVGDSITEPKRTDEEYNLIVVGRDSETGEEYSLFDNVVITQKGKYLKQSLNLTKYNIDEIEIKKNSDESGETGTYQVILQKYLSDSL